MKQNIRRFEQVIDTIDNLNLKKIRKIMAAMSNPGVTPDHLIFSIGITMGEFATAYVINNKRKRSGSKESVYYS